MISSEVAPRVDAQASGGRTRIGGWYPVLGEDGQPDPKRSPWFSLEIRHDQFPWVSEKGGKPSLIIATLEALAVLMALKVFYGEGTRQRRTKVLVMPTWTDNRGNGAALNKLTTARYPASAVLMEMASCMKALSLKVQVEWTPRSGNQDADELANGVTSRFSENLRVDVRPESLEWQLLPEALRLGREAEEMCMNAKRQGGLPIRCIRQKRK